MCLGEECMVELNSTWMSALRQRQEYHHTTSSDDPQIPKQLKLSTFLKWGELRPATRKMLELAYQASHSSDILSILNGNLQDALTFSDVVTLLLRENVDLLKPINQEEAIHYDTIEQNMKRLQRESLAGRRASRTSVTEAERESIFAGAGLTIDQQVKVRVGSMCFHSIKEKVKRMVLKVPKLCDIVEPVKCRYYSVASSSLVHPNELHLCVQHVRYEAKSAVEVTSPLLASTKELVLQRGAGSDFLVRKSMPRYHLAIEAVARQAGLKHGCDHGTLDDNFKFLLTDEKKGKR